MVMPSVSPWGVVRLMGNVGNQEREVGKEPKRISNRLKYFITEVVLEWSALQIINNI